MIDVARIRAGAASDCGRIRRTAVSRGFVDVENLRSSRSDDVSSFGTKYGCQGSFSDGALWQGGSARGPSAKLGSKLKLWVAL